MRATTGIAVLGCLLSLAALPAFAIDSVFTPAGAEGPAQTAHAPAKGPGPVVILLSGASGPNSYQSYSGDVSRLGYYAVLLDGNHILTRQLTRQQDGLANLGPVNLRKAIERAQGSPHAIPGKAVVIGFSMGGGGAIAHAVTLPELVLAGGQDTYRNCCLIESMRAMESAAKEINARFELVVYPEAKHGFNLEGSAYRRADEQDAWRRTLEMLRQYSPLPANIAK